MKLIFGGGDIAKAIGGTIVEKSDCDVTQFAQVKGFIDGHMPDVVIVTAGVSYPSEIWNSTGWREEIEVNLIGAFNVAQAATITGIPCLIFIASVAGLYGKPKHSGYSASKAGVISLVQSLAEEGYNAYAISPGRVNTKMRQKDYPGDTPGSRLTSEQVADVVHDILEGKYKSGDNILIRKVGLDMVVKKVAPTPWRDELAVGQPVTI